MLQKAKVPGYMETLRAQFEKALKESADASMLEIVDVIPELRTAIMKCREHGQFVAIVPMAMRMWKSGEVGRQCPHCKSQSKKGYGAARLSFDQIVEMANTVGLKPAFEEAALASEVAVMPWQCKRHKEHIVHRTVRMLARAPCEHCAAEGKPSTMFRRIKRQVAKNGDELISARGDCANRNSVIRYRCAKCGQEGSERMRLMAGGYSHECGPDEGKRSHAALRDEQKEAARDAKEQKVADADLYGLAAVLMMGMAGKMHPSKSRAGKQVMKRAEVMRHGE